MRKQLRQARSWPQEGYWGQRDSMADTSSGVTANIGATSNMPLPSRPWGDQRN
jgi:hypothetical protein